MINVIKRKGNVQPYNEEKIMISLANSAEEAGIFMSHKEAQMVAHDVTKSIIKLRGEDALTSSMELRILIGASLRDFGFSKVADVFDRGKINSKKDIERHARALEHHMKAIQEIAGEEKLDKIVDDLQSDKTQLFKKNQ
jgi:transcriptional regulator NrdR family protein